MRLTSTTRVALVIGNSQYAVGQLRNPGNDAEDMSNVLRRVGFAVTLLQDADQARMENAVETLCQQLSADSIGLFYFAGHGIQVADKNYLIPIGATLNAEADVKFRAVSASWVQERLEETRNAMNVLILDACRDNPLSRRWRSNQRGLAPMSSGADTFIAFSTLAGQVAADGTGRNSPYTKHLVRHIVSPGLQIEEVFRRVRDAVVQETKEQQRPQEWTANTREFYFVEPPSPPVPPPATPQTLRNSIGMEFVLIPAGEFAMGSQDGGDDEKPVHQVRISQLFYLGKFEVTQEQWLAVMGQNPSGFQGDGKRPVESVSWEDVQEFIRRLNAKEGESRYRLPTEAEWEYAARAGSTTAYSFGNGVGQLGDYAWYDANADGTTHPVGQKLPNAWGLYDMHGNVWEWVQDWYAPYAAASVVDPAGPTAGDDRVLRGGGWFFVGWYARSAQRNAFHPGDRDLDTGFRLARGQ